MIKKTMLLALAVGALVAFAAPTVASAQLLTDNGSALGKTADVTATSTNTRTTTAGGTLECDKITIHAEVTANSSTTSELVAPKGQVTDEHCTLNQTELGGGHVGVTLTTAKTSASVHFEGNQKGVATVTFVTDIGTKECGFQGSPQVTYATNTDTISVGGALTADPLQAGCPPTGTISGDFTLETADGTEVIID